MLGMTFPRAEATMGVACRLLFQLTLRTGFAAVRRADSSSSTLRVTNLPIRTRTLLTALRPWSPWTRYAVHRTLSLTVAWPRFDQTVTGTRIMATLVAIMGCSSADSA